MADTHLQRPASPMSALAWGALAIGGIFAIIIGLVAVLWPDITLRVVVVLLGAYAFISGIFTVLVGAVSRTLELSSPRPISSRGTHEKGVGLWPTRTSYS